MKKIDILANWILCNKGYEYYLNARFLSLFSDCEIVLDAEGNIVILYENYIILHMAIVRKSIHLLALRSNKERGEGFSVQKKLYHEYNHYFDLLFSEFILTQHNMYALIQYMVNVKKKIMAGFEKYVQLIDDNFDVNFTGYLMIGINNVFSLEQLRELLEAYNRLYSLIYFACQNGIDNISECNISEIGLQYSMVLESIHIGSEGLLVSVGVELIVDIIKSFIKSVYEMNRNDAEKRKQELIGKAELEEFVATRQYIFQLINLLDSYLDKKERGCNLGVMTYMEIEIDKIVQKIEQLQGTSHIDLVV